MAFNTEIISVADGRVKVASTDSTPGYLISKIIAGSGVSIAHNNIGGNESLTISAMGGSSFQLPVSGVVNGINTSFEFASLPTLLVVDGDRVLQENSADGTNNWNVMSLSPAIIELVVAPVIDIFAL